jgi:hypothetical protein|tara:strand:+ start:4784 stop:5965 length:1182 start_codon:yes stop_codon:yes gene_type:complete
MATFLNTTSPTPFGIYDGDDAFQADADNLKTFVKQKLGDDILSVELTNKQVWACFEESTLEYSSIINQYQAKSTLGGILGSPTGSLTSGSAFPGPHGQENRYPAMTKEFLKRMSSPFATEASVGGDRTIHSGSISVMSGQQDYNLHSLLSSSMSSKYGTRWDGGKFIIREIFHFEPAAAFRFFDSTTAINYLNNEFSFESFTPETVFYVLPIWEDVMRGMQLKQSQRIRRSHFSYEVVNNQLRIFPEPTNSAAKNLWIRFQKRPDPFDEDISSGQLEGVSNLSNVPFGNIEYRKLNSIARQWIREFTLGLCTELLGRIRSKFGTIPIPGTDLTLNGTDLVTQGQEKQTTLKTELKELLDSMTYDKIAEQDAMMAENLNKQLKYVPFNLPIIMH